MKKLNGSFSILLLVFACANIGSAQTPARVEAARLSDEISVATYDPVVHGDRYPGFLANPSMKALAIVVTNSSNQPIVAAQVLWKWVGADGKPGQLVQEHNSFVTFGGFVADPRSSVLILPDGTATRIGQRQGGMGGMLRLPPPLSTAQNVTVALDAVVLADGKVIGPDTQGLVDGMKGRAEAGRIIKEIAQTARAEGRDPKPDIDRAIADTSLSRFTRFHLGTLSRMYASTPQMQLEIQLPNFHR